MTSPASFADNAVRDELRDSLARRRTMVDCQIRTFDVTDHDLLARLVEVPRERFVPDDVRELAYSDIGFSMRPEDDGGEGRYLLPPMVLARLIQAARIRATDALLDVACGAGYSTAIVAGMARSVVALEAERAVVEDLRSRLDAFGLFDVRCLQGDLTEGAKQEAPFDVILVNGAVETNLEALFAQLAEGGRLLTLKRDKGDPTGRAAKAMCFEKRSADVGSRYLFDASAPVLRAFRQTPRFDF